ncbi:heavy-metal-associated domain-containing protein [Pseudonocardia nigra]|uniref:heavy-metal-associated domain-containing protein n=1 Tax=Pseudonocardia nigra TaxID=1921578 RepID=UPI001C5E8200|nr:cation transporter [Pseudonocardia nigra]
MPAEIFSVPEISCGACQAAIEGALKPIEGIRRPSVDVVAKQMNVDYDEALASRPVLVAAIHEQGYDVEE